MAVQSVATQLDIDISVSLRLYMFVSLALDLVLHGSILFGIGFALGRGSYFCTQAELLNRDGSATVLLCFELHG